MAGGREDDELECERSGEKGRQRQGAVRHLLWGPVRLTVPMAARRIGRPCRPKIQ